MEKQAARIMVEYWNRTNGVPSKRYLWNDAFAVCVMLRLHHLRTSSISDIPVPDHVESWRTAALSLVDQVHSVLGRFRMDDPDANRRGKWLSGQKDEATALLLHPTAGGLRIGKELPGRKPNEPYDDEEEWSRDGQYFHYLTKWMNALPQFGEKKYGHWSVELMSSVFPKFYCARRNGLYWKMSEDLSFAAVQSCGLHDALDAFVTIRYLKAIFPGELDLESKSSSEMVDYSHLSTSDALGIGGLLQDGSRILQLLVRSLHCQESGVSKELIIALDAVLHAVLNSLCLFENAVDFQRPASQRLAFRELGLAIGLASVPYMMKMVDAYELQNLKGTKKTLAQIEPFLQVRERIMEFWSLPEHQANRTWRDHAEINSVMLAAALIPESVLQLELELK
jgi:hypothetical protein